MNDTLGYFDKQRFNEGLDSKLSPPLLTPQYP